MIMNCDGEGPLLSRLSDDVLVQMGDDIARAGNLVEKLLLRLALLFLIENRLAKFDALAADIHVAGALDEQIPRAPKKNLVDLKKKKNMRKALKKAKRRNR